MINAYNTFVYFYLEESVVFAPKNKKRVGGRINLDTKAGFTAIIKGNLGTIQMDALFVV